jgi:hypothetical protein|tara:strand:+ start:100 stop:828 length:729 start_codon:yes stop_codon:yes gene_type:complete
MVNIDTVYQRVLAVANKEQRGYITPQEFNLFANQAQMDIFEQYFYDVNQFSRAPGNETEYSDMLDLLNEKIDMFQVRGAVVGGGNSLPIIPTIYRLGGVFVTQGGVTNEAERVNEKDWSYIQNSPLMQPKNNRPIYIPNGNGQIQTIGHNPLTGNAQAITVGVSCNYIARPSRVEWGYVVVNGYAQFDGSVTSNTTNFDLHESEETNLVLKILQLSGIVMKDVSLYQVAAQEEVKDIQQEKS